MSSVSFNIGFSNERNSSRVLKPPGGGHTDIFGVVQEQVPQKQVEQQEKPTEKTEKTENGSNENGVQKNGEEPASERAPKEDVKSKEESKAEAPKRTRVPPGGFSSGFWWSDRLSKIVMSPYGSELLPTCSADALFT